MDDDRKTERQAELLSNRLEKRWRHLRKWARRTAVGAFRLYDRDIPEIPLVLDMYLPAGPAGEGQAGAYSPVFDGEAFRKKAALCGALYKRPYEKAPGEEAAWLSRMTDAAGKTLGLDRSRIFLRERRRRKTGNPARKLDGHFPDPESPVPPEAAGRDRAPVLLVTPEGGLRFRVNLTDRLDTGLFPDRRLLRSRLREEAGGKTVLNLFAYTCAFSVYAAAGGALAIDSVDMSGSYLEWGMKNFSLNGFAGAALRGTGELGAPRRAAYRFIREDALRFLPDARRAGLFWDIIILDPPVFSNSAKMRGTLDILRDQREILEQCLALLSPGGRLYFSVSAKRFRLEEGWPGFKVQDLAGKMRDADFQGKRVPAVWLFERSGL